MLHIIIISSICLLWGLPVYMYCVQKNIEKKWTSEGMGTLLFLFFSGIITLSLFSSWLVLFLPLRFEYLLFSTLLLALILFVFNRNFLKPVLTNLFGLKTPPVLFLVFGLSCILLFLVLGTLQPVNIDTQLYHLQIIRWTNEYGTVPGLANLYPRLGLGSNWFNLISFFYIPGFKDENFTFLNATITIWFLIWLLYKLKNHSGSATHPFRGAFAIFFFLLLLYFLFDWQLLRDTANSTSYDFIVSVLTIIVLTHLLENVYDDEKKNFSWILIFFALSVIPFKLSGIFILFPVFFYLAGYKSVSPWGRSLLTGIVVLAPLLIKNYIITGYPLFPSTLLSANADWTLPPEMTEQFREYVLYVNKFYNQNIGFIFSYEKTALNWIPYWWQGILLQHKILLFLSTFSIFLFFKAGGKKQKHFFISGWLMFAGWFFTAPDPRFAYGFILFLAFFPVSAFISKIFRRIDLLKYSFILLCPLIILYTYRKSDPILKNKKLLLTVSAIEIPPYLGREVNTLYYYFPARIKDNWNNRCFFVPLPCICEENPYIEKRGAGLGNGFRMKPVTDSNFIKHYNY